MNKLTTFHTVSYGTAIHGSGMPHFFNDTEFFSEYYSLVLGSEADAVDVGFNIGMQAELMLPLTRGKIYGFEASKKIFDFAKEKFAGNPRIELHHCAIADSEGTAQFIDTEQWGAGSLRHTAGMDYCKVGDAYATVEVQLMRLDTLLAGKGNIGLMKLDIEGAELSALEGARELIRRNRPFIVMEYCHNALSFEFRGKPITGDTLFEYAKELGYKVYNIYGICLSNPAVWRTSILQDTADVYLIPDEQHERWVNELLPVYQYRIYDKVLEVIEWDARQQGFFALTALPGRIYEVVNTRDEQASKTYLGEARARLTGRVTNRGEIFATGKLSRRGEILLALIYDDKLDEAYRLACIKAVSPENLRQFEELTGLN
ncbi:MAG: FkbM family methyltransferase [Gammaproteobacteria bacterium]|nr:FkbM family methyltransferase [Gammaproteobacteria bacterium]MBU1775282.1 FkbM family methyltransferase [Gammaproteobacteria bacterium]MBU1968442.1 FkbM family methyltransferase [Gammaproteobacteria bacterium]